MNETKLTKEQRAYVCECIESFKSINENLKDDKMKRYIILFNNGQIVQQAGLNATYMQLHNYKIIKLIIDTEKGEMITQAEDGTEWKWIKISIYHDSSLITDKDKLE